MRSIGTIGDVAGQHETTRLDQRETKPFVEPMGMGVGFLGIQQYAQHLSAGEIAHGLSHQACADALAVVVGANGNAYQKTNFTFFAAKLIADEFASR